LLDALACGVEVVDMGLDVGANLGKRRGVHGAVIRVGDVGCAICETQRFVS